METSACAKNDAVGTVTNLCRRHIPTTAASAAATTSALPLSLFYAAASMLRMKIASSCSHWLYYS